MATVYPLPTLSCTVNSTGISAPAYSDVYQSLQASFQTIYGSDAYIDPDSQDGQLLAIFAKGISDCNNTCINVWNKYAPSTATDMGLSSQVKINGLTRAIATNGTVLQRVIGTVGAIITAGVVVDANSNLWNLTTPITIPLAGYIDVTATAISAGALSAPIGTITTIFNPQFGWQSTTNTVAAQAGAPVELDAALRRRQAVSTALPSQTVLSGTQAAILQIPGVTQAVVYENDTNTVNANGLPPNSISAVVFGGDATAIANAIFHKKTPGAYTNGSTAINLTDFYGLPYIIRFSYAVQVPLSIAITILAKPGYVVPTGARIQQALADYVNALTIGQRSDLGKLYLPAQFFGAAGSETFEVNVLMQGIKPATPTAADITIALNANATLAPSDVILTVVTS